MDSRIAELCQSQIDDLQNHTTLSDWEVDFIESITERLNNMDWLSDKQIQCLSKIWHDKMEKGEQR